MILDVVLSGALVGLFTAAFIKQCSEMAAGKTLDLAGEEMDRVLARIRGEKVDEPETEAVLDALMKFEMETKVRTAQHLLNETESDGNLAVQECRSAMKLQIKEIEEFLVLIQHELEAHRKRWFQKWLFSNVRPMLDKIKSKLDSLDDKVNLLLRLKLFASVVRNEKNNHDNAVIRKSVGLFDEPAERDGQLIST